jgi:hypothetical protein
MTFAEIIPALLHGEKVKRSGWTTIGRYLDIYHGAVMDSHPTIGSWHWLPMKQDLEANDWEIVE